MWDLKTIKHMNTPEEVEKSQTLARATNGERLYTPDELDALGLNHTYPYTVKQVLDMREESSEVFMGCVRQSTKTSL